MIFSRILSMVGVAMVLAFVSSVHAASLNLSSGAITINTDTLAITGDASFTGTNDAGVARFDFDAIHLGSGVNVTLAGNRPLHLRATGDITIDTVLDANGGSTGTQRDGGIGRLGGYNGGRAMASNNLGSAQGGFGPAGGSGFSSCCHGGAGGGHFGKGGNGSRLNTNGNPRSYASNNLYGDLNLATLLHEGGSGGAGGGNHYNQGSGGGAGGGALGLTSTYGAIHLLGTVTAEGGTTGDNRGGGGGAGGAIRLDAYLGVYLDDDAIISANGGNTLQYDSPRAGGGGGGGIVAVYAPWLVVDGAHLADGLISDPQITALGGLEHGEPYASIGGGAEDGQPGIATFFQTASPVPAPGALFVGLTLMGLTRQRRRRNASPVAHKPEKSS